jgi:hypothetical protein
MNGKSKPAVSNTDADLIADPEFPWRDGNPYDIVNRRLKLSKQPTLGPTSSAADVNNAGFSLQAAERKAWDRLRLPGMRLAIDFFHYPMPNVKIEDLDPSLLERPMPVAVPDLMSIVDCRVELTTLLQAPDKIVPQDVQVSELIDFTLADLLPSPLCAEAPLLSELIEVEDDQQ